MSLNLKFVKNEPSVFANAADDVTNCSVTDTTLDIEKAGSKLATARRKKCAIVRVPPVHSFSDLNWFLASTPRVRAGEVHADLNAYLRWRKHVAWQIEEFCCAEAHG